MRIDKLLVNLRLAKTRTQAQRLVATGHLRCNGARVVRRDLAIAPGDVLTVPRQRDVLVLEVLVLPGRRGPASAARACYRLLDAGRPNAIGAAIAGPITAPEGHANP